MWADELLKLFSKAYRHFKSEEKTVINVGVVGYPNVGKSSLVNFLKHANVTTVAATPGTTKAT